MKRSTTPMTTKKISRKPKAKAVHAKNAQSARWQIEELHELAQELIKTQDEQRRVISRELHDNIAQVLSAATNRLALTKKKSTKSAVIQDLDKLRNDLLVTLAEVRKFARDLRPAMVDQFCLCRALDSHVGQLRERVPFDLVLDCQIERHDILDIEQRTSLYRIAQEALNNIEKHSAASQAWVRLHVDTSVVHLEIGDNGRSFDRDLPQEAQKNGHLGLLTMRERAEMLGGELHIHAKPGAGTTVHAAVPLNGRPGHNGDKKP
jgi:signal transduction histidine kinase